MVQEWEQLVFEKTYSLLHLLSCNHLLHRRSCRVDVVGRQCAVEPSFCPSWFLHLISMHLCLVGEGSEVVAGVLGVN